MFICTTVKKVCMDQRQKSSLRSKTNQIERQISSFYWHSTHYVIHINLNVKLSWGF
jgi:hypothetical protein